MRWQDRVYGEVEIEDPAILDLIDCETFQRLRGIHQAGPSALPFPFKDVTRFEHSLGVFVLLRKARRSTLASRSRGCCTTSRTRRSRTRLISSSRRKSRTITSS